MITLTRAETPGLRSRMDWMLAAAVLGLCTIGTLAVLSAASPLPYYGRVVQTHFVALAVGVLAFLIGVGLNYQVFANHSKLVYQCTLGLLLAVLVFGQNIRGHRSWLRLGHVTFQPTSMACICMVLVLASFLDKRASKAHTMPVFLLAGALVAPIALLILKQPDLSSTLVFFVMTLAMLFCAGASVSHLACLAGYGVVTLGLPVLWTLLSFRPEIAASPVAAFLAGLAHPGLRLLLAMAGIFAAAALLWRVCALARVPIHWIYFVTASLVLAAGLASAVVVNLQMKVYQRSRFVAMVAPEADAQGAAYNVNQALVAIGSGGLAGKGIFQGTQSHLGFLPERHTDFIFAVVGEEMGFWGACGVVLLYLLLIWRVVSAARLARDRYGFLVCCGIAAMFAAHLLINVGMCLGLFPVAGIPLPLLSYGGSSLVVTLWALGIVVNVYSRHYAFL